MRLINRYIDECSEKNFLFLIFSFLLAACGSIGPPASVGARSNSTNPELNDINGIAGLKAVFNQDQGKVRLILLLSPT